jgi:hypothetical protein
MVVLGLMAETLLVVVVVGLAQSAQTLQQLMRALVVMVYRLTLRDRP